MPFHKEGPDKKPGALVAMLAFGKKKTKSEPSIGDDTEEEAEESYEDPVNEGASYDAASEALLQQLNVPQGRRPMVKESLKEVIHACLRGKYEKE